MDSALASPPAWLDTLPWVAAHHGSRAECYVDPMTEEACCLPTTTSTPATSRASIPVSTTFDRLLATLDHAGISNSSMELVRFPITEHNSEQLADLITSTPPPPSSDVCGPAGFFNTERGS